MESYEEFIQRHHNISHNTEDEPHTPLTPSSLIVFRGCGVLPPVLDEQQRDEMRRLRDTAISLMKRRTRREEESDVCFTDVSDVDAERHMMITDFSAPPTLLTYQPLTSTAHDDPSANQMRASSEDQSLESTQITVLFESVRHKTHRSADALDSQMMMSSGYVTNDNTDVTCQSSWIETGAVQGSDIISHTPVDGTVLEAAPPALTDDITEVDTDEGPYRMSLQNLLKKSQDYRRRQRLLRSQAKALKPDVEEHNLSDKENEELPKHIWKTELRRAREKKKEKMEISNQTDLLESPVTARSLYASKQKALSSSSSTMGRPYLNIPTPKFCLSPVRCKKAGGSPAPVRTALTESDLSRSANDGAMMRMSEQTEQIAQLELNLSSLKTLISDLESTLTLSHADRNRSPADTSVKQPSVVTFSESVTKRCCGIGQEKSTPGSRSVMGVLTDTSNHSDRTSSLIGSSYDVNTPSCLWNQLTPETGGHEGVSRVKRRLLMNEGEHEVQCSLPRAAVLQSEDQVTALMEEERRRQQEVLQSLALRYQFLRSVSFPCPSAGSRLEDTPTSILASSVCTHTELTDAQVSCLPLLVAVVKGFLTRRLLRTERVSHLIRTIKDTQMFLQSFQRQSSASCRSDLMLHQRVTLQLRAARLDLHQLMFVCSSSEHMQLIRQDRQRRTLHTHAKAKVPLSAATRKALERKKRLLIQQSSAGRKSFSPSAEDKWNLVPKICRLSKKSTPIRGAP